MDLRIFNLFINFLHSAIFSECKRLSALCSRDSIVDVAGCLNVPGMPTRRSEECGCKGGRCYKEEMSNRTRKACCNALHICFQAKNCAGALES